MRVLVLGSGGRESAIAWACRRHGHEVSVLSTLPDDAGPSTVDLVIPGPEQLLADGVADECARRGLPCFGPSAATARLESSKGWARDLAGRLGIPGPRYARFDPTEAAAAADWCDGLAGGAAVVKADGLAGGKGVTVPHDRAGTLSAIDRLAASGSGFVLEERLHGPEVSLMALCDGHRALALPLAQDHKRIGEGDTGPNTGGMGAYAPAPVELDVDDLVATFVQPILDHLRAEGTPYVGVLYAGLMLTAAGPRLIEYNVRFGDPETQAVLPLLDDDLAALARAAVDGALPAAVRTSVGASCSVVLAAPGYPDAPVLGGEVAIPAQWASDSICFPAGCSTRADGSGSTTGPITGPITAPIIAMVTGGRVLAVTGTGPDLAAARDAAYRAIDQVHLDGGQVRRDIAWRAPGALFRSYADAGVDIDEGARAVEGMKAAVERTHGSDVLRGIGSFGGAFSARGIAAMDDPVLVASTDGVGTKVELAARLGRVRGVGHDIVNHCIDDVLVQRARPLFFLDYLAASRLDAALVADVVTGMAEACEAAGCALLGGETAEMPGVYAPGAFDVAGTLVGVVERAQLLPRDDVAAGDVLVGLASSGPHTNGYSLLRRMFAWLPPDTVPDGFDRSIADALLEPHRSYLHVLEQVLASGKVKALAHITGGGLPENLPRVLPAGVRAEVQLGSWPVPPLFRLVRELATAIDAHELHRTLNMGVGMVVVCAATDLDAVQGAIDEPTWVIGRLVPGERGVELLDG